MATMQKAKQKKKKKLIQQEVSNIQVENNLYEHGEEITNTNEKKINDKNLFDFPILSTRREEIPSHECFVSSEYKANNFNKSCDNSENMVMIATEKEEVQSSNIKIDQIDENEYCASAPPLSISDNNLFKKDNSTDKDKLLTIQQIQPSAPDFDISEDNIKNQYKINYPDLTNIGNDENQALIKSSSLSSSKLKTMFETTLIHRQKPFTSEQLKELYFCKEIDHAKQFELEFLTNSLQDNYEIDPLYELLLQYSNLRNKIKINLIDLQNIQNKIEKVEKDIWTMEQNFVNFTGTCGDKVYVRGKEYYEIAVLKENNLELTCSYNNELRNLLCFSYTTNIMHSEMTKLKVEQIIQEILLYPAFSRVYNQKEVGVCNNIDSDFNMCISHLRRTVSILFIFIRRPPPDKEFLNDIKEWIKKLLALHLRVASKNDHWFFLFHMLRCPSGISQWATQFLQIPFTVTTTHDIYSDIFNNAEINHCISILKILLMPIKKRNEFLQAFSQRAKEISDSTKEDLWILVDSDGEDNFETSNDGSYCPRLRENDLISLLNQIPFEALFRLILKITKKDNDIYIILSDNINGNYLLKLIAFFSTLVEIFGEGLLTYNTEKYKQFTKRLGRLIRHTIQYLSDYHTLHMSNKLSKDSYQCERIKIEFDSFVVKSCSYLYRTRNLGTWQYFLSLPFSKLDISTCWYLFYCLNFGFSHDSDYVYGYIENLPEEEFWKRFNISTADISQEDMYYLLQTFSALALERNEMYDYNFIQHIFNHIFNIGFVIETTKDTCYKNARDILTNMCSKYPELISYLVYTLKNRISDIEMIIYLFKSLSLNEWRPDLKCFEILSIWLLNYSYDTKENQLSRIIINHLNWEFSYDNENELFLSYEIHVRMACLICSALNKHAPERVGYSGVSESVRQITTQLYDMQNSKDQFILWCWNMISILRLHLMDQYKTIDVHKIFENPAKYISTIPDLEEFEVIFQGVTEQNPISIYTSLLITSCGHSIPLICQKGFAQIKLLLSDCRHSNVIRCLHLIMPLFLECPEALIKNEGFIEILKTLFNADRTYIKMAKELIAANSPGLVLELLSNMIQSQIINYSSYCLSSPTILIDLWLQALTSVPNWATMNINYLIDVILKIAYQFPDSWYHCQEFFRNLLKGEDPKTPKKMSLTLFLGSSSSNQIKNLPIPSQEYPWLALILLELEFELYENRTRIWSEFLRQLNDKDRKSSLDNALKKATSIVGSSNFQPQSLVIYKYANILSLMEINNHLFPIICQKFFNLYLARISFSDDEQRFQQYYGVSDKFYEYNISLMKKVKSKLKLAEEYYLKEAQENAKAEDLSYFHNECSKIMKSFLLWLEETSLNNISSNQNINLPPQFRVSKLKDIFEGNTDYWTEFIYLPNIRKEQTNASNKWLKTCFRYHSKQSRRKILSPSSSMASSLATSDVAADKKIIISTKSSTFNSDNPVDRIQNNLKSYDKPLDPPELVRIKPLFENLNKDKVNLSTLVELRSNLKILDKASRHFTYTLKELNSLSGNYRDLMKSLYKNISYQIKKSVSCSSSLFSSNTCNKPATITIDVKRPVKDEDVQRRIHNNRERHDTLVSQLISQNIANTVLTMRKMEFVIKCFVLFQMESKDQKYDKTNVSDIAIQFFYDIIKNMNEDITTFPPMNELFLLCLSELGIFIRENQETQGIKILETTLKRPEFLKILSEMFVPSKTNPEYFISMYKFLIDSHMRRCDKKILFVLFSKFDLQNWLQNIHPKLHEINRLLKLIQIGLENWNQPETLLIQDLFRRHFIQIFEFEFPEHYGEVLQIALNGSSEQRIMPVVLLDLINSILTKCNCDMLTLYSNSDSINQGSIKFATQQNLFTFKAITDTIILLGKHFHNERLQHLHGLYPKHKNYCAPLAIWFSCFGCAAVASAIFSYPGALADQICDWVFAPIIDMFSPWLVTYTAEKVMQQTTANWIKQLLSNGKMLYPWGELYVETAQTMIFSFINCLQYILDSLPVSNSILGHIFSWYDYHFAKSDVPSYIRTPIHSALIGLPWNRFQPHPVHIEIFHKTLQEYLPECHSFFGYIFVRIQWSQWIQEIFSSWNHQTQIRVISQLLVIIIKLSFEPHLHDEVNMSKILEETFEYPWNLIEYQGIENVFNWLILTVDPVIVIKLPTECNSVDLAVLELLKESCGMAPPKSQTIITDFSSLAQSKRVLYTKSIVRLLRACSTKHEKLLATKDGSIAYQSAIVELLENIEKIHKKPPPVISTASNSPTSIETNSILKQSNNIDRELLNMCSEIICSLTTQGEVTSKLFVEGIIIWQSKCDIGSRLVSSTLNSFGLCKSFTFSMYSLLEVTIYNYFRYSDEIKSLHSPTWPSLMKRLNSVWNLIDLATILKNQFLLILHGYIINKIESTEDIGEKITFLEYLSQLLEPIKTNNECEESKLAIIWGAMIIYGCNILKTELSAKKPLLMLARYLQIVSTQSEGWSEGLLGVIGFKKDTISNKRKILTRCLSCLIFSLFPHQSTDEKKPSKEFLLSLEDLKSISSSKKYMDVKLLSSKLITIIEENYLPDLNDTQMNVINIVSILYDDYFVLMACELWKK